MLKNKDVNLIRDAAVKLENLDLKMAHDLMAIAYDARPNGPFIKKKLEIYQEKLDVPDRAEKARLQELVSSGDIAIIPIGFRCYTKTIIREKLGLKLQASLPFDSGFFSPSAVASVLAKPKIELSFGGGDENHAVCIKTEKNNDNEYGLGIKFESSTYEHINSIATSRSVPNINKYLDSTFGFYTLDIKHKFVLAHYNWHPLASEEKSKGVVEPKENLQTINLIMERRIERMMQMIDKAKHVFFVFGENQKYKYIQIDSVFYDVNNFEELHSVCTTKFGDKFTIVNNINDGSFRAEDALRCLD